MIIEGQVHGGLTEAFAIAMGQGKSATMTTATSSPARSWISSCRPRSKTPHGETDFTVTPSPHHPIGAKGVGESPNVGGRPGVLQRRQRRVLVFGEHAYPDAA